MHDFSMFEYCYRDAANYKSFGRLLLKGVVSIADLRTVQSHFESGEFFIAEQLSIPPLYVELWALSGGPTVNDHVWHTFQKFRPATSEEITEAVFDTVSNLISKIEVINAWDQTLSPHWNT